MNREDFQEESFKDTMAEIKSHRVELTLAAGCYSIEQDVDAIVALFNHAPAEQTVKAAEALGHILNNLCRRLDDRKLLIAVVTQPDIFPEESLMRLLEQEYMACQYRVLLEELAETLSPERIRQLEET